MVILKSRTARTRRIDSADRQLYAVKKVKLDPDDKTMKKKICVKVKLDPDDKTMKKKICHRHIVRLFQTWIEGKGTIGSSTGL
ncbi:hypothetical protein DD238_007821 [Peronospora effusa]|uniref:Uncharacterized protein n=1 Tax=Peronospora effusa TaxID=542832 RepID=A0A3M6V7C1_9STRA|nr:hypothetical protein DD238_007821 [Peronospora effusa]